MVDFGHLVETPAILILFMRAVGTTLPQLSHRNVCGITMTHLVRFVSGAPIVQVIANSADDHGRLSFMRGKSYTNEKRFMAA